MLYFSLNTEMVKVKKVYTFPRKLCFVVAQNEKKSHHYRNFLLIVLCHMLCYDMVTIPSTTFIIPLFIPHILYQPYLLKITPWQWHFTALWNEAQHLWQQQSHFVGKWKKLNNIWWWLQMLILFGKKCPYFYFFKVPKLSIGQKRKRYWNWISKLSFMCILLAKL